MRVDNDNSGLFKGCAGGGLEGDCREQMLTEAFQRHDLRAIDAMIHSKEYSDTLITKVVADIGARELFTQDFLDANLTNAAYESKERMVTLWVSLGADIHHNGDQPLQAAILGKSRKVVAFLRSKGCEVTDDLLATVRKAASQHSAFHPGEMDRFIRRHVVDEFAPTPSLVPLF